MAKLKMVSPWINYYHELVAFFKYDSDVAVIFDEDRNEVKLYVESEEKAEALAELLPRSKDFGNITLTITVVPSNYKNYKNSRQYINKYAYENYNEGLFNAAFNGNRAFIFSESVSLQTNVIVYIVFRNEVVQYFNDDLGDYYGQCSTLFQNIAADIFEPIGSVHYCTDKKEY